MQVRQLGGAFAVVDDDSTSSFLRDAKLFAMTFACGFLFTTIFLA
ncbi:MAG TPA: hypothetical protein VFT40_14040 [Sphingomicrobium sp.]|nr:hypothetical protein [Sphingomicrobium sp.]